MPIKELEIGKAILANTSFNVSGNTELRMVLTQPDGTVITKLKADGVSAPAVDVVTTVDGVETTFLANEYLQYLKDSGVMTPDGAWKVHAEYVDGTPKDLAGDVSNFNVLPRT